MDLTFRVKGKVFIERKQREDSAQIDGKCIENTKKKNFKTEKYKKKTKKLILIKWKDYD